MTQTSGFFLRTARLGFRTWSEQDLDLAIGLWGDVEVTRLIDTRGKLSDDQVRERLLREIATAESYGIQYWPIFRLDSREHVGCCGLRPYDWPANIFEIGFHICSAHWGCGYASEAAAAVIGYAFEQLEVRGLYAGHNPANHTSRHLLNKLGFRYTHDEYYAPTGLDHPAYMLTADVYKTTR
jgi:[ribosomal protein S5]-alanine N-acetyltransferase